MFGVLIIHTGYITRNSLENNIISCPVVCHQASDFLFFEVFLDINSTSCELKSHFLVFIALVFDHRLVL